MKYVNVFYPICLISSDAYPVVYHGPPIILSMTRIKFVVTVSSKLSMIHQLLKLHAIKAIQTNNNLHIFHSHLKNIKVMEDFYIDHIVKTAAYLC